MTPTVALSSVALLGAILLEWYLLNQMMREIWSVRQRYIRATRAGVPGAELLGKPLPQFSARTLDTREVVSEQSLIATESVLLFFGTLPVKPGPRPDAGLLAMLYGITKKTAGPIYVVLEGSAADCRMFKDYHSLDAYFGKQLVYIDDESGQLRTLFGIDRTPAAVKVDSDGVVSKIGATILGGNDQAETAPNPVGAAEEKSAA